jgi:hypothetical protein
MQLDPLSYVIGELISTIVDTNEKEGMIHSFLIKLVN